MSEDSKKYANDPTDDRMYDGIRLEDFIRHFSSQVLEQQKEITELNEKKFAPFPDPLFPETMPAVSRREKRNQLMKSRKAEKKKQTLARQTERDKARASRS